MNPDQRRQMIEDFIDKKTLGEYHARKNRPPTAEEQCIAKCRAFWREVELTTAVPLLRALPSASAYDMVGTMKLLRDAFDSKFNSLTKDELVFIISLMHTEEMTKHVKSIVDQGLVGADMDKPI
jgi:hypothetical protein